MIPTASVALNQLPLVDSVSANGKRRARVEATVSKEPEPTVNLVLRAKAGDQAALDDLFQRYQARLRRWAHGRLPPAARGSLETQDLVQETLVRLFRHLAGFEPRHPGAFRDYAWTTLFNAIRDTARKYRRQGPTNVLETDAPGSDPSPLEVAMGTELFDRYESAMERLRLEDRAALLLRLELGLSHAEVAEILEKPSAAAAYMAVSRALARLAKEMAAERQRHSVPVKTSGPGPDKGGEGDGR
jgi:RNA polymerase sigma-70 factor (ECF subfamily)